MNARSARWVAWSLVAVYFTLVTIGLTLQLLSNTSYTNIAFPVLLVVIPLIGIWPIIGAFIISRHPRHPVGWLLSVGILFAAFDMFFSGYVSYDTKVYAGALPGISVALIWLKWSAFPFSTTAFTLMILLFPDGRPLSPFWRKVAWAAVGTLLLYLPIQAVEPGFADPFTGIYLNNPLEVSLSLWETLKPLWLTGLAMLALCNLAALICLILRQRQAEGEEQQQIKWLIIPATIYFASIPLTISALVSANPQILNIAIALVVISVPAMAIAVAFAIFRYRLYDIDIIINRTLVYGALTASVVGLYVLIVGGTGLVIQTNLNLAGLLITVVLAGLIYRPIHGFFQRGVDRLMYGKKGTTSGIILHQTPDYKGSNQDNTNSLKQDTVNQSADRLHHIARILWYPFAAVVLCIFIASIPGFFIIGAGGITDPRFSANDSSLIHFFTWITVVAALATATISLFLATLLFRRNSGDPMALFTSFFLLAYGVILAGPLEALEPFIPGIASFTTDILIIGFVPLTSFLFAIFPDGHFVPSWTRWTVLAAFLAIPVGFFWTSLYTQSPLDFSRPYVRISVGVIVVMAVTIWLSILYAQIYRYRNVSNLQQRQQTKWVIFGIGVWLSFGMISAVPWTYSYSLPLGTPIPMWLVATAPLWILSIAIIPITLTIAVMRYRLFDVDIVINRTLVYGGLTVAVIGLYALIVGAFGVLFQAQENLFIALIATGLVAVIFQPLRQHLQRWANRLVYGERDEPFEALARLGRRLEGTFSPEMVYPTIVKTVAQALKLPYVAIAVKRGEEFEIAEVYGSSNREPVAYPLTHQGEVIGRLLVGRRSPDEEFTADDERLLRNFAWQAGTAVHAVQLTADLQHSRRQLITAREEERLRLRRDLHDGLGPALASIVWQADSARDLVYSDPSEAVKLLESSIQQAQAALVDIRRLVYGLRPPALDELGLVGALEQASQQFHQMDITIKAPAPMPSLPAAVEVAAYRIIQEALKNAVEHGKANHCIVCLAVDGNLCLTIGDDGRGMPKTLTPGVGLISMRERAEELGGAFWIHPQQTGGTEVEVNLPLELGG